MSLHRTPLRYPGGKQRLTRFIEEILECNNALGCQYVEPYAGGAGVAIELLLSGKVRKIHLNDSSRHIYAFWHSVKHEAERLCRLISGAALSLNEWEKHRDVLRNPQRYDLLTLGFSTFYLNRCNRSGVLTAGVIGGKAQSGRWRIDARFPRNELIARIEAIAARADDIIPTNSDAERFMTEYVKRLPLDTFLYCDPPYFERAKRLYLNTYGPADHVRVASVIQQKVRHRWIVSYDSHPELVKLYSKRRKFVYSIQYSAIRSYTGREVFIFADSVILPRTSQLPYVACALPAVGRGIARTKVR